MLEVVIMRLIKIIIIVVIVVILILTTLTIVTSRGFAQIADLINRDTEMFYKQYSFSEPPLKNYQINGVLFIPYTNHNPLPSYDQKFHNYSLNVVAYRQKGNNSKVIINKVTLEGINDIEFDNIAKVLNKDMEFSDDAKHADKQLDRITLIDEINNYDMKLTNKSQIKVVLNVSVEENGKITTGDLEYMFETKMRKYLVQQ